MDIRTAQLLSEVTSDFYRRFARSFSDTRQSAWPGWDRCAQLARARLSDEPAASGRALRVLDLACGNLRFERFLAQAIAPAQTTFFAVDGCGELLAAPLSAPASQPLDVRTVHLDVVDTLFADGSLADALAQGGVEPCDLSASFGFLHHVPLASQREQVLRSLVDLTRPGGLVVVSLWRFLDDDAFARKARAQHERNAAALGLPPLADNDLVLGWRDEPDARRFCHSFTDGEVDELACAVRPRAFELERFRADGRTGAMNDYLVLQVR